MINVLVITLFSGEAEIAECKHSVSKQRNSNIKHLLFEGLTEIDAHNQLLETFEKEKNVFDLYVKVDADTIINHDNAFEIVYSKMISNSAAAAQLYLHDYFTSRNINGLNFYIPTLNQFYKTNDKLFCDRSIRHLSKVLYSDVFEKEGIIPVGNHCLFPNDRQSFHYGFHSTLQANSTIRPQMNISVSLTRESNSNTSILILFPK